MRNWPRRATRWSQDIPFTVREDLTVQLDGDTGTLEGDTLIVTDKPLTVKFAKVDSAGNPLAGAVLTLTDKTDGKEIDRWTTTTEPHEISIQTEEGTVLVADTPTCSMRKVPPRGICWRRTWSLSSTETAPFRTMAMPP